MANKNDSKILELKEQIKIKKDKLKESSSKFQAITNLSLEFRSVRYNLNVLQLNDLVVLLVELNALRLSAKDLGIDNVELSGYNLEDWITDIQNKINSIGIRNEENSLKAMESKLDKMLSDEKKTELELEEMMGLLK